MTLSAERNPNGLAALRRNKFWKDVIPRYKKLLLHQTLNNMPQNNDPLMTKENFWNELSANYPNKMAHFLAWVDQFKRRVDWNNLFNSNSEYQDANGKNAPAPKVHELPDGMQIGIYMLYCLENPHRYELFEGMPLNLSLMLDAMRLHMRMEEKFFEGLGINFLECN